MSRLILKICIDKFKSLPRDENGAAMMITLAVVLFLYLLCSSSYAIGMTINEKIQLQNAADAAAYSAAVVEADGLSRIATINRAMSWTYIQTVKRRMDYIVLEWLNLTVKNFQEDSNNCRTFNHNRYTQSQVESKYFLLVSFHSKSCSKHVTNNPSPSSWWCGWTANDDDVRLGYVTKADAGDAYVPEVQYGRFISFKDLAQMPALTQYNETKKSLQDRINNDDKTLENLTALLVSSIHSLGEQVEKAAIQTLKQNLPENSGNSEDYFYRVYIPVFSFPYSSENQEQLKGVLSSFRNTEEDELEFLASSVDSSSLHNVFGDGIDQWFIRGTKESLEKDVSPGKKYLTVNEKDYVVQGFQRGYKSANRIEPLTSNVVEALRANHVAWGDPSDGNTNLQLAKIASWVPSIELFYRLYSKSQSDFKKSYDVAKRAPDHQNPSRIVLIRTQGAFQKRS